jgi:hypothetical protein
MADLRGDPAGDVRAALGTLHDEPADPALVLDESARAVQPRPVA